MNEKHQHTLPIGYQLQEYQLKAILGIGGFGITYLAWDTHLKCQVAIKEYMPNDLGIREQNNTIQAKSSSDESAYQWGLSRFMDEAATLSKFKHPNIIRVSRLFKAHNTAYMVMDYEEGDSLSNLLAKPRFAKGLPQNELENILYPLLQGLQTVHDANILHRDIKPGNIYIRRKDVSPVLLDFGAARDAVGRKSRSITSIVTPGYSPYEQYSSDSSSQGPWTDIYAMAAVVYKMICGKVPVDATERTAAQMKRRSDPLPSAQSIGQGRYDESLLIAVDNALAVLEEERPQTVNQWQQLLSNKSPQKPKAERQVTNNDPPKNLLDKEKWLKISMSWVAVVSTVIWISWFVQQVPQSAQDNEVIIGNGTAVEEKEKELIVTKSSGLKQAGEIWTEPTTRMKFVWVPKGSFMMGSESGDNDEKPVHSVSLDGFWIGQTEVTVGQFRQFVKATNYKSKGCWAYDNKSWKERSDGSWKNPGFSQTDKHPVVCISWDDTQAFIKWLKSSSNYKFGLPTEAQWEYACRSGGKDEKYSGGNNIGKVAWYTTNTNDTGTREVKTKLRNGLGIYDKSGNVWEWVQDWYDIKAYSKYTGNNPVNTTVGSYRVNRGGSWDYNATNSRCAHRSSNSPSSRINNLGVRLARTR